MDVIEQINEDDKTLNEMLRFNKRFQSMIQKHTKKIEILREKTEERLQKCTTTEMRDIVIKNTINYLDEYYRTDDDIVFQSEYGKIINDKLKEDVKQLKEDVMNDLRLIDCEKNLNGCLNIVSIVPDDVGTIVPYDDVDTIVPYDDVEEEELLEYNLNDISDKTKSMVLYEEPLIKFQMSNKLDQNFEDIMHELKNSYKNKFGNKYRKDKDEHVYDCVHFKKWKKKELKKNDYTEPIIIRKGGTTKRDFGQLYSETTVAETTVPYENILKDFQKFNSQMESNKYPKMNDQEFSGLKDDMEIGIKKLSEDFKKFNSQMESNKYPKMNDQEFSRLKHNMEIGIKKLSEDFKNYKTDTVSSSNAVSSNAVSSNAVSSNAVSSNAVSSNAVSSNAVSSNAVSVNVYNKNSFYENVTNMYEFIVDGIVEDSIFDAIYMTDISKRIDNMTDNIDNIMLLIIQNSTYLDITDYELIPIQPNNLWKPEISTSSYPMNGGNTVDDVVKHTIRVKMLNDLDHDFKKTDRNDMNVDNKDFLQFFYAEKTLLVSENEFFQNTILDIGYENMNKFVISKRVYFKESNDANKQHISKFKEVVNPQQGDLYIVEDMSIAQDVKTPLRIESFSTKTNIMDPITQSESSNGYTKKNEEVNMIYPKIRNHIIQKQVPKLENSKKNLDTLMYDVVTKTISEICTEFFQAIPQFNLKYFDLSRFKEGDGRDETFYHFPVQIDFNNLSEPLAFNFYAGMFTVKRINLFIWKVKNPSADSEKYDFFVNEGGYKEQKIMDSIRAFYGKLFGVFKNRDLSILFIQLMKTLGDHAQVYEMNLLLKGAGNVIFGSKDKIIIAEAIRLDSPVLFTMREINSKFPDYFNFPDDVERNVLNLDDIVFFYQGSRIKNTTVNVRDTLNDVFSGGSNFDLLTIDFKKKAVIVGSTDLQYYINTNIFDYLRTLQKEDTDFTKKNRMYMKEFVNRFELLEVLTSKDIVENIQNILSIIEMFKVFETINNTIQNLLYTPAYISRLKSKLIAIENRINFFHKNIDKLKDDYIKYTNKVKKTPPPRISKRTDRSTSSNIYKENLEKAIQTFEGYAEKEALQLMNLNSPDSKETVIQSISKVINKRLMKQNKYIQILFKEPILPKQFSPGHSIIATMMDNVLPNYLTTNTSIKETIASIYETISKADIKREG
jgi:hypothetical protein